MKFLAVFFVGVLLLTGQISGGDMMFSQKAWAKDNYANKAHTAIKIPKGVLARKPQRACSQLLEKGTASWYGPGFHGAKTQNREVFDKDALTAAHMKLPFGTKVKVVNRGNGKSVVVRINDRGRFGKSRVIDVSQGAAQKLGMIASGVAPVALYKCPK